MRARCKRMRAPYRILSYFRKCCRDCRTSVFVFSARTGSTRARTRDWRARRSFRPKARSFAQSRAFRAPSRLVCLVVRGAAPLRVGCSIVPEFSENEFLCAVPGVSKRARDGDGIVCLVLIVRGVERFVRCERSFFSRVGCVLHSIDSRLQRLSARSSNGRAFANAAYCRRREYRRGASRGRSG